MNPTTVHSDCGHAPRDAQACARLALACLDLTSLNPQDTERTVTDLCRRAQTRFGPVAAVCVWPQLAAAARACLPDQIAVAAVANFPHGGADIAAALRDTAQIVQAGAQEVDLVLPYRSLLAGDEATVRALLAAVRAACPGLTLKVILETGELQQPELILRACQLSLAAGADFLKTSTGKTPVGATPEAARTLLAAIAADPGSRQRVGFKASGGIRTLADASVYLALTREWLGAEALTPRRFRLGASSLLDDIVRLLGQDLG